MTFDASVDRHDLPLAVPFEIARGEASETATVVAVEIRDDGDVGIGAAAPSVYYGETPASVEAALPALLDAVEDPGEPIDPGRIERRCRPLAPAAPAARAAVSIAAHDLAARRRGEALYESWGLDPTAAPDTSVTIGIADPSTMADRAAAAIADGFDRLKVKLGTDDDRGRVDAVRTAAPDATIRVDANGAWEPAEAVNNCRWLADAGVELVEQPVPAADRQGLRTVREASPVPVAADEACVTAADVPDVADAADVVVVKLMKCGGIGAARRQIAAAHDLGLDVMLGCMVESAASISAACHLAPLVEYADLDGALLLAEDVYAGVPIGAGRIDLAAVDVPGTGVREA